LLEGLDDGLKLEPLLDELLLAGRELPLEELPPPPEEEELPPPPLCCASADSAINEHNKPFTARVNKYLYFLFMIK